MSFFNNKETKESLDKLYQEYKKDFCDDDNVHIFKLLAENGYLEAMAEYGGYLCIQKDNPKGESYLQRACEKGDLYAHMYFIDYYVQLYTQKLSSSYLAKCNSHLSYLDSIINSKHKYYGYYCRIKGIYYSSMVACYKSSSYYKEALYYFEEANRNGEETSNSILYLKQMMAILANSSSNYKINTYESSSYSNNGMMNVKEIYIDGKKLYYKNNKVFDSTGSIYFYIAGNSIYYANGDYYGNISSSGYIENSTGNRIYSIESSCIKDLSGSIVAYLCDETIPYKNI